MSELPCPEGHNKRSLYKNILHCSCFWSNGACVQGCQLSVFSPSTYSLRYSCQLYCHCDFFLLYTLVLVEGQFRNVFMGNKENLWLNDFSIIYYINSAKWHFAPDDTLLSTSNLVKFLEDLSWITISQHRTFSNPAQIDCFDLC